MDEQSVKRAVAVIVGILAMKRTSMFYSARPKGT